MGLTFCCPSCGADLRVNPAVAVLVSCPGCGEPIRVPRRPHPREAATDAPALPPALKLSVVRGLNSLTRSVWAFAPAATCVAASFLLRVAVGHPSQNVYPTWLPPAQFGLAIGWLFFAIGGCVHRMWGYRTCRTVAMRYNLDGWVMASVFGTALCSLGVVAVVPLLIGRPVIMLPPTGVGLLLIGLSAGLVGVLLEFAFLSILNRLLWETVGWQAATQTGRYVVGVVTGGVVVMASLCLGVVALVITAGGEAPNADAAGVSVPAKVIAGVVILTVGGTAAWLTWRFARLLRLTRDAVCQPEPTPEPPVPSGG